MELRSDTPQQLYGLLAEFPSAGALIKAAERVRGEGYTAYDAFAPYPVEGLDEAMNIRRTKLPAFVLLGALVGGLLGYFMQYYAAVVSYPWNVGGKPLHSWPAFMPITFELAILGGALAGLIAMIALNKLPMPYHALFNAPGFDRASQSGFFLCIEAEDAKFDHGKSRQFLESLGAMEVTDVAA